MAFSARERFLDAVKPPEEDRAPDHIAVLLKLAELLAAPAAVKARLGELQKATEDARKAAVDAGRERAAVAKLRAKYDTVQLATLTPG